MPTLSGGSDSLSGPGPNWGNIIGSFGNAAQDLFSGFGLKMGDDLKAAGFEAEAANYGKAAVLARQNEEFATESTAVKNVQTQRQQEMGIGAETTAIGANGFQLSGSGEDVLRASHQQAGLETALIKQQGLITEAGYEEQANAYDTMASYATSAAETEEKMGNMAKLSGMIGAGAQIGKAALSLIAL